MESRRLQQATFFYMKVPASPTRVTLEGFNFDGRIPMKENVEFQVKD